MYPLQTAKEAQARVQLYFDDRVAGEDTLKEHGLRPVKVHVSHIRILGDVKFNIDNQNVFWSIPNSDPHEIISQDLLHLWHMGLFGRHKFEDFKKCVGELGCEVLIKVDNQ
jgi:hypothetical protein